MTNLNNVSALLALYLPTEVGVSATCVQFIESPKDLLSLYSIPFHQDTII